MSLQSEVAGHEPAYLGASQKQRFERVKTRMVADADTLIELELNSCLALLRSKLKLREVEDVLHLARRTRYLAELLAKPVPDESFLLLYREYAFRCARHSLRRLRKSVEENSERAKGYGFRKRYYDLLKDIRKGGLSLREIGATAAEMEDFKKRSSAGSRQD